MSVRVAREPAGDLRTLLGIRAGLPMLYNCLAMQKGRELERLVATLERALAGSIGKVEAPSRRLLDRDTGRPREHDVLITWNRRHHQIITAIECRDRKRPVGVPDVEAFADKCATTGVNHGVIVSATGFRHTARRKAATRGIACMEMAEAEAFDWLGMDHITGYHREFRDWNIIIIMFGGSTPPATLEAVLDDRGQEVSNDDLAKRIVGGIPTDKEPVGYVDRDVPVKLQVLTPGWTARVDGGQIRPIDHILAKANLRTTKTLTPIQRHTYSGEGHQYSFASAKAPINGIQGSIMMVQDHTDEEGGTQIYWIPDKPAGST